MNGTMEATTFDLASYQSKLTGVVNALGQGFNDAVTNTEPFEEYELPVGNYRVKLVPVLESDPTKFLDIKKETSKKDSVNYAVISAPFKIVGAKPKDGNPNDYLGVEFVKRIALFPYVVKNTQEKKLIWVDKLKSAVKLACDDYPTDSEVIAAFTVGCLNCEWDISVEPRSDNPNKTDWRFIGCPVKPTAK